MSDQRIVDMIVKLMALSKSSNQHEAELAAASAAKLIARYQIDMARVQISDHNAPKDDVCKHEVGKEKISDIWKSILIGGVAASFGCRAIIYKEYAPNGRNIESVRYEVVGRSALVAAVHYMFTYLVNVVVDVSKKVWAEVVPRPLAAKATAWYTAFRRGMVSGLCDRMEKQREETLREETKAEPGALVLVRQDEVEISSWLDVHLPKLKKGAPAPRVKNADAFMAGHRAAQDVSLGGNKELPEPAKHLKKPAKQINS